MRRCWRSSRSSTSRARADLKTEHAAGAGATTPAARSAASITRAIESQALDAVLAEIDRASTRLLAQTGKVGQHLRDNEWLMAIKQRTGIPGGVCEFDLPAYHHWLHDAPVARQSDLQSVARAAAADSFGALDHPQAAARERKDESPGGVSRRIPVDVDDRQGGPASAPVARA